MGNDLYVYKRVIFSCEMQLYKHPCFHLIKQVKFVIFLEMPGRNGLKLCMLFYADDLKTD